MYCNYYYFPYCEPGFGHDDKACGNDDVDDDDQFHF